MDSTAKAKFVVSPLSEKTLIYATECSLRPRFSSRYRVGRSSGGKFHEHFRYYVRRSVPSKFQLTDEKLLGASRENGIPSKVQGTDGSSSLLVMLARVTPCVSRSVGASPHSSPNAHRRACRRAK